MRLALKIDRVRYHRNGVGGEGFFAVAFHEGRRKMIATLFDEPGQCAVIDPADIEARWRGDMYEDELRAAIQAWDADQRAYA